MENHGELVQIADELNAALRLLAGVAKRLSEALTRVERDDEPAFQGFESFGDD